MNPGDDHPPPLVLEYRAPPPAPKRQRMRAGSVWMLAAVGLLAVQVFHIFVERSYRAHRHDQDEWAWSMNELDRRSYQRELLKTPGVIAPIGRPPPGPPQPLAMPRPLLNIFTTVRSIFAAWAVVLLAAGVLALRDLDCGRKWAIRFAKVQIALAAAMLLMTPIGYRENFADTFMEPTAWMNAAVVGLGAYAFYLHATISRQQDDRAATVVAS